MRRVTIVVCLFLMLVHSFTLASPAMAADEKGVIGKQVEEYYSDEDNKPGLMERTLSDVLIGAANFLIKAFGMKDVTLLVFGKNPDPTSDGFLQGGDAGDLRSELYLGTLSEGMMNAVDAIYTTFERFIPYPVVIALLLMAFLLLWHGYTGEGRTKAKDYATAFVVGLLSVRFGVYLWKFIASIVSWFTDLIWAVMVDYGLNPGLFLNTVWGTGEAGYDDMVSYRGFVVAVLVLLAAFMTAKLNYDYTIRSINLMLLLVTFVACCILTLFPRYRNALQTWWDQFVANMILPCAHALAIGLFFLLLYFSSDGVSNWVIVAYLFGFSSIQNLVQRLLGTEQPDSKMGKALGFGTLLMMGKMFSGKKSNGASNGKTSASKEHSGGDGSGSIESMDDMTGEVSSMRSTGGASGSSSSVMSGAKPNFRNRATNVSKKVAGFALNQGAKGVGAALGASIGLMAGRPAEGAFVGGAIGGFTGKGVEKVGQGGMWLGKKAYSGIQKLNGLSAGNSESVPDEDIGNVMSSVSYYEEKPMQRSTTVVTEQPFRPRAKGGSGVINEGVVINGGRFDKDLIVTGSTSDTERKGEDTKAESTKVGSTINRGVRINGGNFKGNVIVDEDDVTIKEGVIDAEKIKNKNGETVYSSRETKGPTPSQSPSSAAPKSGQSTSPPSGGKHYNYHV
ncbi:hypothetical protein [Paenibacillus apis]|uniref:Uncharacterized protein n=1 Tax=Paenibacillus apis TaxID=1792174 RepID=A0A919Y0C7_9BACL|nr:hypothetical protein [Paenibacillus apis]GIO42302.1 hypothetical protein J41TS4_20600 [Paenibacillus apis]